MFSKIKELLEQILSLHAKLKTYEKESVVQAMPSLAFVNRAKKCMERGEYRKAEKCLEDAMELPQEDALVYKYLGIICERTDRLSDAIVAYKKSANIDAMDKEIWRLLGFALVNTNQPEEAEKAFENANKITAMNTDVLAGWGMSLMKQKRYQEAHEKFMDSVRINKYNFMALLLAAVMEVRMGKYGDAESKLSFLSNVSPNENNTYEYANLKYLKGDYDNALHYVLKSLELNDNMLPSYLLSAKLYAIKGEKDLSLNQYQKAFDKKFVVPNLYFDWAVTSQMFGEYELAREYFNKVLEFVPAEEEVQAGLAVLDALNDDVPSAQERLNSIKNLPTETYLLVKAKSIIAFKSGNYEEAISGFKSLLEKMWFDNYLNIYIAFSYEAMGNTNLAKEYFEKALLHKFVPIEVYSAYSRFLINLEEYASAQRKLRRALKSDENNIEILNLLFQVGYKLVKENSSEYNVKETLSIANKILTLDGEGFVYRDELADLESMTGDR